MGHHEAGVKQLPIEALYFNEHMRRLCEPGSNSRKILCLLCVCQRNGKLNKVPKKTNEEDFICERRVFFGFPGDSHIDRGVVDVTKVRRETTIGIRARQCA